MIRRVLPLLAIFALTACGGPPPPPQVFPPLDYSYLPPIVLKVSNINVVNQYVPDPSAATLIGQDPEAPANALSDMLNRRVVAGGTPGNGIVTIEAASIEQVGNSYTGIMTVRVDVQSADGKSTGYTEASVTHSQSVPDDAKDIPSTLYAMTKALMDTMNVQLQYQLQHNLSSWISYSATPGFGASGGSAAASPLVPGTIQATPLTAPAGAATPVPATGGTLTLPSGTLTLPSGAPTAMPPASPMTVP
jgi:hypothetical protein